MNIPLATLGSIAFCALLIIYGLTFTYGVFGANSRWVQRARAAYAHRAPSMTATPLSPSRLIVATPLFGLGGILVFLSTAFDRSVAPWFLVPGIGVLLLCFVTMVWPRPFLPRWAREADERVDAGLEPTMPPPPELAAYRSMPRWQWIALHSAVAVLVLGNLILDVNPRLTGPLLLGWGFLAAAHARSKSDS